ncbi:DUF6900 domain-containing protein [Haloferula sp. A504]|uniref:DUF6900 domain-containing protein n=1 Tax=Haloferula sp. A504 TaxID=3373601 RepID=UPI0031C99B37|nr:hypothetical protein [Verrucomicrobiaceae bacterium E54]
MKKADTTATRIAREVLGLDTLETRHSDGLDFHDLAVWQIREALVAAYEAGHRSATPILPKPNNRKTK